MLDPREGAFSAPFFEFPNLQIMGLHHRSCVCYYITQSLVKFSIGLKGQRNQQVDVLFIMS